MGAKYLQSGRCLEGVARKIVAKVSRSYALSIPHLALFAHVRLIAFPGIIYLDLLRVGMEYRGMGVAKKLLAELRAHADKVQKPILLAVVPQDEKTTSAGLWKLYQSEGFVKREGRLPYPSTRDKTVDLIYWPKLVAKRTSQPELFLNLAA